MIFELCTICALVFALWIIGKLLMLFDIVHVPKKRVHTWRHVKHLNHVSFQPGKSNRTRQFHYANLKFDTILIRL